MNSRETYQQPAAASKTLDVVHQFWKSMILKTLLELKIPDHLSGGQKTVAQLADLTDTQPDLLFRVLRAAVSCGFISEGNIFASGDQKSFVDSDQTPLFRSGQADYHLLGHLISKVTVQAWNGLTENLHTGVRAADTVLGSTIWEYLAKNPEANENFNGAMTALSATANPLIVKFYPDFDQFDTIVDIGGGHGTLLSLILAAHPTVKAIIFDRKELQDEAEQYIQKSEYRDRLSFIAGDFFLDELPSADAFLFKNVFHDWNDEDSIRILKNVRRATHSNTRVVVAELVVSENNASFASAGLDVYMLLETGGQERTAQQFEQLFQQAGFTFTRFIPAGRSPYGIVEGKAN